MEHLDEYENKEKETTTSTTEEQQKQDVTIPQEMGYQQSDDTLISSTMDEAPISMNQVHEEVEILSQAMIHETNMEDPNSKEETSATSIDKPSEEKLCSTILTQEECTKSTPPNEDTAANGNRRKKKKAKSSTPFFQRHRNASIVAGCLLLSIGGGFGGTLLALKTNQQVGNGAVLYQSVNNTSKKSSNGTAMSIKDVANQTMNSVVEIKTESVSTNSYFQQAVQSGAGSGVILSKDGYIVTNNHVISGANKITVTMKDDKSYEAKLVGNDSATDLAILKIEADNLTPAVMGDSSKLEVGDTAIAIGNPLGELGGTVTTGIISALDRAIDIDNQTMHLLQTNAAINPGNSGGGLFNDQGELIGIVNAKSSGESIEGLGFAIPIDRAKSIITNLIENGYVKGRASLGVTLTVGSSNPFAEENGNQVYIYQVSKGKAADKAGLMVGDQILKVNDTNVGSISDVSDVVNAHKAGDTINVTVLRENDTKTIKVTLGEADASTEEKADNN